MHNIQHWWKTPILVTKLHHNPMLTAMLAADFKMAVDLTMTCHNWLQLVFYNIFGHLPDKLP